MNKITGKTYDKIIEARETFTKSERVIADYLMVTAPADLIFLSITELAEKIGVAEATILRFCRKIGFSGFQEYKLMLSQDQSEKPETNKFFYEDLLDSMLSALRRTSNRFDISDVEKVAQLIVNSNRVFVFAVGTSAIVATAAQYRLLKCGVTIHTINDPHMQSATTANLTPDDLVIFVSVSGSTKDIIEVAQLAKANDVPIVTITNRMKSPLAGMSDCVLYSGHDEAPFDGGSLTSVVAQCYIIDVVSSTVYTLLGQAGKDASLKASNAVKNKLV